MRLALENNPEPLKLTFDEPSADLLSKIMQGTDERYRLSVAFQMRPVMIMPGVEPHASLLVGIDYTTTPETIIGRTGVDIDVLPSLGPRLDRVEPEVRDWRAHRIRRRRPEWRATSKSCWASGVDDCRATAGRLMSSSRAIRRQSAVRWTARDVGRRASAGRAPAAVATRTRSSNLLAARLLPTVSTPTLVAGTLSLTGLLLGTDSDDIVVAFYQDGRTVRSFDVVTPSANQQTLTCRGSPAPCPPARIARCWA